MLHKNIKKEDIAKALSLKTGYSLRLSKKLIDDLIQVLIENIKSGSLSLKNIGSFKLKKKNERIGRNPKTKKEYLITSRRSVLFSLSSKISDNIKKL